MRCAYNLFGDLRGAIGRVDDEPVPCVNESSDLKTDERNSILVALLLSPRTFLSAHGPGSIFSLRRMEYSRLLTGERTNTTRRPCHPSVLSQ